MPKKIFLGTFEIGRHLYDLADAFGRLGHEVETGLVFRNPQHPNLTYDHDLDHARLLGILRALEKKPINTFLAGSPDLTLIRHLLTAFDVYVFQWGQSLLPGNLDLPILKALGKTVISIFNGTDIRHYSSSEPFWEALGMEPRAWYRDVQEGKNVLPAYLGRQRMAELHADAVFAQPNYAQLALRPYRHLWLPLDLSLYRYNVPGREVPVVVHAPSNAAAKGTDKIMATLERLRSNGVAFELRLLQGVSNEEVIRALVDADVVVDQLKSMTYGILAAEGMATGCAVAGGVVPAGVPLPNDRPMQHIDDDNLYEALEELLVDRELRCGLAEKGRALVERHHDHVQVAQHLLACAESSRSAAQDYYPTYYANTYRPPDDEPIPASTHALTTQVLRKWGLPHDADLGGMVERGAVSRDIAETAGDMPRWSPPPVGATHHFWGWVRPQDTEGANRDDEHLLDQIREATEAARAGEIATASALMQRCIDRAGSTPGALQRPDVQRAFASLSAELGAA